MEDYYDDAYDDYFEFWGDYFDETEDGTDLVALANELAENTSPEANWDILFDNPTSRDLQPYEEDWFWQEHDEFYDVIKQKRGNLTPEAMDEEAQQQFPDPVEVIAQKASIVGGGLDDADDGVDGGLRKKQATGGILGQHQQDEQKDSSEKSGSSTPTVGSSGKYTIRIGPQRNVQNPNLLPLKEEILELVSEDDEKKVYLVDTGGMVLKLRTVRKNVQNPTPQPPPTTATTGTVKPSPLRSFQSVSDAAATDTVQLRAPVPSVPE